MQLKGTDKVPYGRQIGKRAFPDKENSKSSK